MSDTISKECVDFVKGMSAKPSDPKVFIIVAMFHLKETELEILREITARLLAGQQCYGPFLKLKDDKRDMTREAYEELVDASVYLTRKLCDMKEKA